MAMLLQRVVSAFRLPSLGAWLGRTRIELTIEILKVDPSPVVINTDVVVVFRVTNHTAAAMHVKLDGRTDEDRSLPAHEVDLGAKDNVIRSATTFLQSAGFHTVNVEARRRTDQTILVPSGGPTPTLQTQWVYDAPQSDQASVMVYADSSLPPVPMSSDVGPVEPIPCSPRPKNP